MKVLLSLLAVFQCPLFVDPQKQKDVFESVCRIPMITSAKEEQKMIATCRKVKSILTKFIDTNRSCNLLIVPSCVANT